MILLLLQWLRLCELNAATSAYSKAHKSSNAHYFSKYEAWQTHAWAILIVAEIISIVCIIKLWRTEDFGNPVLKVIKSILLLVPILGPLLFYFVQLNPGEHNTRSGL